MSMIFDMSIARPSYLNPSQFPWKTDAILGFSHAAQRRTFEQPYVTVSNEKQKTRGHPLVVAPD